MSNSRISNKDQTLLSKCTRDYESCVVILEKIPDSVSRKNLKNLFVSNNMAEPELMQFFKPPNDPAHPKIKVKSAYIMFENKV